MTTNIYPNNALLSNLKKQITYGIMGIIAVSFFINTATAQNSAELGLHEDQALVCIQESDEPYNEICKVVQILDILDENNQDKLFAEFEGNQDVFPIEALD